MLKGSKDVYEDGLLPIHNAVISGDKERLLCLIKNDTNLESGVLVSNELFCMTPLMLAAYYGNKDIIKILIENGAKIDKEHGEYILTYAMQYPNFIKENLLCYLLYLNVDPSGLKQKINQQGVLFFDQYTHNKKHSYDIARMICSFCLYKKESSQIQQLEKSEIKRKVAGVLKAVKFCDKEQIKEFLFDSTIPLRAKHHYNLFILALEYGKISETKQKQREYIEIAECIEKSEYDLSIENGSGYSTYTLLKRIDLVNIASLGLVSKYDKELSTRINSVNSKTGINDIHRTIMEGDVYTLITLLKYSGGADIPSCKNIYPLDFAFKIEKNKLQIFETLVYYGAVVSHYFGKFDFISLFKQAKLNVHQGNALVIDFLLVNMFNQKGKIKYCLDKTDPDQSSKNDEFERLLDIDMTIPLSISSSNIDSDEFIRDGEELMQLIGKLS